MHILPHKRNKNVKVLRFQGFQLFSFWRIYGTTEDATPKNFPGKNRSWPQVFGSNWTSQFQYGCNIDADDHVIIQHSMQQFQ